MADVVSKKDAEIARLKAELKALEEEKAKQAGGLDDMDEHDNDDEQSDEEYHTPHMQDDTPYMQDVLLCSDNIHNVVAEGVIIDGVGPLTIHGVQLTDEYARVRVTKMLQEDAEIPCSVGEIQYVRDTYDTFLPWPKDLIMTDQGPLRKKPPMSKSSSKDMSKPPMTSPHLSSAGSHINPENTLTEGQPFVDHIMNRIHVSLQFMVREFCRVKGINSVVSIPVDPTFMNRESIFLTSEDVEQVATLHMIGGSAMIFGLRYPLN
ncbi:uncharacterized protein LOC133801973 [Humulus lupulus]|uniref:uncharacterized protein LOC133801973 n=1 Tax=Humulus lupulus TaxID=3486 RepID=UPI002B413613|nr:uncharacterized protein LOC133801973 [Humulus lupulus]